MNREQLGRVILQSGDMLYRVAKTLLYSDDDCADAIQETVVKAFTKIDTLRQDRFVTTWLVRILMNECYAIMRRESRTVSLDVVDNRERRAPERTEYSDLYEALRRLPQDMRLAVTLHYVEGYSVKETAAILDATESAVKSRLLRARRLLKRALEDEREASGL